MNIQGDIHVLRFLPVSMTPVINLSPVSMTLVMNHAQISSLTNIVVDTGEESITDISDISSKSIAGVNNTLGKFIAVVTKPKVNLSLVSTTTVINMTYKRHDIEAFKKNTPISSPRRSTYLCQYSSWNYPPQYFK